MRFLWIAAVVCSAGGCSLFVGGDTPVSPTFSDAQFDHGDDTNDLSYSMEIEPGDGLYLIVTIAIGGSCNDDGGPAVSNVTWNDVDLERLPGASILGVDKTCTGNSTHSEQWGLASPTPTTGDVHVVLVADAQSLHSAALSFVGVDPAEPVRESATSSGYAQSGSVDVSSAPGDLVVSSVGQGHGILATASTEQEVLYVQNNSENTTLDNSAASSTPATGDTTTMGWTYSAEDASQIIATSLRPLN